MNVLADNVDFLNIGSQNKHTHPKFNVEVDTMNHVFKSGGAF